MSTGQSPPSPSPVWCVCVCVCVCTRAGEGDGTRAKSRAQALLFRSHGPVVDIRRTCVYLAPAASPTRPPVYIIDYRALFTCFSTDSLFLIINDRRQCVVSPATTAWGFLPCVSLSLSPSVCVPVGIFAKKTKKKNNKQMNLKWRESPLDGRQTHPFPTRICRTRGWHAHALIISGSVLFFLFLFSALLFNLCRGRFVTVSRRDSFVTGNLPPSIGNWKDDVVDTESESLYFGWAAIERDCAWAIWHDGERTNMGPIDPEGSSDTKAIIVAASPSSGASSLNAAANAAGDEMAPAASTTTITITDVDGGMHVSTNNGAASTAPSAPPITATASSATVGPPAQTANVSTGPTSGYSSVYLNNRNYNILLGGKTSRIGSRYLTQGSESEMSTQIYIYYNNKNEKDIDSREGNKKKEEGKW